jgi:hypothetical protein
MSVEWVKDTPKKTVSVTFPEHWIEFLEQEARYMNEKTGTKKYNAQTVIFYAVKRFAYERGFVQMGGNRNGVVVRRDDENGDEV